MEGLKLFPQPETQGCRHNPSPLGLPCFGAVLDSVAEQIWSRFDSDPAASLLTSYCPNFLYLQDGEKNDGDILL